MNLTRISLILSVLSLSAFSSADVFFVGPFEGSVLGTFDDRPTSGNLLNSVSTSGSGYPRATLTAFSGIRIFDDTEPFHQWDRGPYPDVAAYSGKTVSTQVSEGSANGARFEIYSGNSVRYKAGRVGVWTNFLPGSHRISVYGHIFGEVEDELIGELNFNVPFDATNQYDEYHFVGIGSDDYAITAWTFWADSGPQVFNFDNVTYDPVPEPATLAVLGFGAALLNRRRK